MIEQPTRLLLIAALTACISACSMSGDWPNLSDKIPDASERVRVVEQASISNAPKPKPEPALASAADAQARLADITVAINTAQEAYNKALSTYEASVRETNVNGTHLWLEAQLALTRFSQTVSTLNEIIYSASLNATSPVSNAHEAKKAFDQIVIAERQRLNRIKPDTMNNSS
ncbi:hypothetical protein [Kordiimonas aquimaris]|uniref:hypothetical protein n=1 Tax=Kordiimonas aquimaris TaxID=707591 RepID=UPI0021D3A3AF|nr:hypothetical protein [Kordiimonas aquimaris]